MDKMEMRARSRAALDAGLLDFVADGHATGLESRGRSVVRNRPLLPAVDPIDESQARAACKPMGELEYVVRTADARGRTRVLYVVVPDVALKPHYERQGFVLEPDCRVLVDAKKMKIISLLRVSPRTGSGMPPTAVPVAGFNPYFDICPG